MKFLNTFNQFKPSKVLMMGDLMLDTYTLGKVKRISPEAPVPILQVEKEEKLPGGMGNAILNAISLGLEVVALGRIGNDSSGQYLLQSLANENVDVRGIFVDSSFQTPVKNRIIAENQQIVRVDYENPTPLTSKVEAEIVAFLPHLLEGVQYIAISDYAKGFVTATLCAHVQKLAKEKGIPIIVDPKGKDFTKYKGSYLIKPNFSEAMLAANADHQTSLLEIATKIINEVEVQALVITRAKDGISLFTSDGKQQDFPVDAREVKDVTGAGDTVLAMLLAALANGLNLETAIKLANVAASIAIERMGCARISLSQLLERFLNIESSNKIFGEDHLFTLQTVLKNQSFNLLALTASHGLTTHLYKAILTLFKKEQKLVLYLLDEPDEDFLHLLASLKEISFIILKTDSLHHLCEQIYPDAIYLLDQKQLHCLDDTKGILEYQTNVQSI